MATEKRLMSIDDFKRNLCHYCNTYMSEEPCEPSECWVYDVIAQTDSVDAVEVVRCKNCKEKCEYIPNQFYCILSGLPIDEDDFCSLGAKMDGDSNE